MTIGMTRYEWVEQGSVRMSKKDLGLLGMTGMTRDDQG